MIKNKTIQTRNNAKIAAREYIFSFIFQFFSNLDDHNNFTYGVVDDDENLSTNDMTEEKIINMMNEFNAAYFKEDQELALTYTSAGINQSFAISLIKECINNQKSFISIIEEHLTTKIYSQLLPVESILLLIGTAEYLTYPQTPKNVIITQYMKLADKYSSSQSSKFVNGVLNAITK